MKRANPEAGLRSLPFSRCWVALYQHSSASLRRRLLRLFDRLEGGQYRSATWRAIMEAEFQVRIGAYSYGGCFAPGLFSPLSEVGRYVSVGPDVRVMTANHPMETLSSHPYFYLPEMGIVGQNTLRRRATLIGHDAWLGAGAIITPGCDRVGIGAVIGAGAVVTRPVPDFAVVAGNPARLLRYRFDEATRSAILASRWWELPPEQVRARGDWPAPLVREATGNP